MNLNIMEDFYQLIQTSEATHKMAEFLIGLSLANIFLISITLMVMVVFVYKRYNADDEADKDNGHTIDRVHEWHKRFKVPIQEIPHLPSERSDLRLELLEEELEELHQAVMDDDIVEAFDALLDIQYILDGTFLEFGMWKAKHEGFDEVHSSNMSKLKDNGEPKLRDDGKVLKSDNFKEPELEPILKKLYR